VLQNQRQAALADSGGGDGERLRVSPVVASANTIKLWMNLMLEEGRSEVGGALHYASERFEAATAARLVAQLERLLTQMAADPSRRLAELALLDAAQQQQVLREWNDTTADEARPLSVHEGFQQQASRRADALAAVFGDQQLSYQTLNARANRLAHHLLSLGLGAELRVALYLRREMRMVEAILAVLKAGAAYVPLAVGTPAERLRQVLEDSQARLILTTAELIGELPSSWAQALCLDEEAAWPANSRQDPAPAMDGQQPAYVIYTSGSTGKAKGVGIEQRQLSNYVRAVSERLAIEEGWRLALVSTYAADLGHTMLMVGLGCGGELHVVSEEVSRDVRQWESYCEQWRVEGEKMTPSQAEVVLRGAAGRGGRRRVLGGVGT